ncbi:2-oxoglutarate-Fe(II) type oxidoreductase ppzD [Pseudolycoriella hygida]|uniref:2-oxoglutarate-Fe(II) type oxidoreductase ppzD n=1 Tax=Pseudolycoriella hygida TaxID=35572 RepID=A0A9Q0MU70_9DIPT|nr:2-oxoglutarate-Fe(II) type oxidoreductase ppzD [Pseudolycoriella hygida]
MNSVPIIDFSLSSEEICEKIKSALADVGFLYIVNHGVDTSKVQNAFDQSKHFFQQLDNVKRMFLQNPPVSGYAGWVEPGQELHSKLESDAKVVDELRECYDFPIHGDGFQATEFQNSLRLLMQECHPLLNKFFRILAKSLDLKDQDFFVNSVRCLNDPHVSSLTTLRSTYYPPIPSIILEGTTRCQEHADYGLVTLLFQDDGGLEVKNINGNWIPVHPIQDSIVVNTGELLEYWTGRYYPATRHRVVVPKDEIKKKCCRQSLVYFIQPDDEVNVVPLRPDSSGIIRPPVNSKEHSIVRLEATYGLKTTV